MDERETASRIKSLQQRMGQLESRAGTLLAERDGDRSRQFAEEQRLWKEIWEIQGKIARLEQQLKIARSRDAG